MAGHAFSFPSVSNGFGSTGCVAAGTATTCARLGEPRQRPGRPPRCGDRDRSPAPRRPARRRRRRAPSRSHRAVRVPRTPRSGRCCRGSAAPAGRRWWDRPRRVCRLRALTPMMEAPASIARRTSSASCTSTSGVSPMDRARSINDTNWRSLSAATINSTRSAPAARASNNWYAVTMKSLRSTGIATAQRTRTRSSRVPENRRSSVSTEMAEAPPASYSTASAAGSAIAARAPLLGLDSLDLGDHRDTRTTEPRHRVDGRIDALAAFLEPVQRHLLLPRDKVLPDPGDDVVQRTHSDEPNQYAPWPMTCRTLVTIKDSDQQRDSDPEQRPDLHDDGDAAEHDGDHGDGGARPGGGGPAVMDMLGVARRIRGLRAARLRGVFCGVCHLFPHFPRALPFGDCGDWAWFGVFHCVSCRAFTHIGVIGRLAARLDGRVLAGIERPPDIGRIRPRPTSGRCSIPARSGPRKPATAER